MGNILISLGNLLREGEALGKGETVGKAEVGLVCGLV